jgi:hypothetical protein
MIILYSMYDPITQTKKDANNDIKKLSHLNYN